MPGAQGLQSGDRDTLPGMQSEFGICFYCIPCQTCTYVRLFLRPTLHSFFARERQALMDTGGMTQQPFPAFTDPNALPFPVSDLPAVNVASVPQRSPLRYPGGKTWLVPHIRKWLSGAGAQVLTEPFAGGGIVSLTAVMEDLVERAIMIEIDHDVAAFWRAALRGDGNLADKVLGFELTRDAVDRICVEQPQSVEEHGFRTLVLNRTRNSGILAPGASLIRTGENGKGISSRWYPETLANRLRMIASYSDRISFHEDDGVKLLEPLLQRLGDQAAVFVDPPYTAGGKRAGARLYSHNHIDHGRLFEVLKRTGANFLMTYDSAPEIVGLIQQHEFHAVTVMMKNSHHNTMKELVITRDPLFA